MGFFSFQTADTQESIWNHHTGRCRPVYLLQPNGQAPIAEPAYAGYGVFGSVDAFVWLAQHNLSAEQLESLSADEQRSMGIDLEDRGQLRWPLKFSFDPNACYEKLMASRDCPCQGYFV